MDNIQKLGIKKNSTNYKAIKEMLDLAKKDESVAFGVFLLDYTPDYFTNEWYRFEFGVKMEFSTEELYQLFKQSKQ